MDALITRIDCGCGCGRGLGCDADDMGRLRQNHLIKTQPNLPTYITAASRFTASPNPFTLQASLQASYAAQQPLPREPVVPTSGVPNPTLRGGKHTFSNSPLPLSGTGGAPAAAARHGTYKAPSGTGEMWTSSQPQLLKTKKGVDALGKGLIYRNPKQKRVWSDPSPFNPLMPAVPDE
jgi:hypothetical protein